MNAFIFAVGGFASAYYWSSTENNNNNAWKQNFDNGNQNSNNRANGNSVRCLKDYLQVSVTPFVFLMQYKKIFEHYKQHI